MTRRTALTSHMPPGGLILLLGIPLIVFAVAFVVPLIGMVAQSFTEYSRTSGTVPGLSAANFEAFFGDSRNLGILGRTVGIAAGATLATLLVGYPLAYYISQASGGKQTLLILLIAVPLLVLVVVRTFGWVVILGNEGLINSVLLAMGLIKSPIRLLYTEFALVLGLVHILLPYMVLAIFASLRNVDPRLRSAAAVLGASPATIFRRVTLPLSLPGIAAGCLLAFTISASAFATPALLGGSRVPMLSYSVYIEVFSLTNFPRASAISLVLLCVVALAITVYLKLVETKRYRTVFG